ncbi:MAG: hypothetical protein CMF46_01030 [Legionellales bacterium]|nr:hypothetical protein [Legionellales bacterium]
MLERLFSAPTSVDSTQNEAIGQLVNMSGTVTIARVGADSFTATKGIPLHANDVVTVSDDGSASIEFADTSKISLEKGAVLTLDQLVYNSQEDHLSMNLNVDVGTFLFSSGLDHSTGDHDVSIHTPVATIGIRGTALICHSDTALKCTVLEDVIEVSNEFGSQILDTPGQTVATDESGVPVTIGIFDLASVIDLFGIEQDTTYDILKSIADDSEFFDDLDRKDNERKTNDSDDQTDNSTELIRELLDTNQLDKAHQVVDDLIDLYKQSPDHELAMKVNAMLDVIYHQTAKKDTLDLRDNYQFSHTSEEMIKLDGSQVFNGNPYKEQSVEFHHITGHQAYLYLGDGNSYYDVYHYQSQTGALHQLEFKGIERLTHYPSSETVTFQELSGDQAYQSLEAPAFTNHLYGQLALPVQSQTYFYIGDSGDDSMLDIKNNDFLGTTIHPKSDSVSFQYAIVWGLGGDDTIETFLSDDYGFTDYVFAGSGNDTVITYGGSDYIYAGDGNDYLVSGNGDDHIYLGQGNDIAYAGLGNDMIYDGPGNDTMYGDNYYSSYNNMAQNSYVNHLDGDDVFVFVGDYGMENTSFSLGDITHGGGGVDRILFKDVTNFTAYFDPDDYYGPYLFYIDDTQHPDTQYVNIGSLMNGVVIQDMEYIGVSDSTIAAYLDVSPTAIDYTNANQLAITNYYIKSGTDLSDHLSLATGETVLSGYSYQHTIGSGEVIQSIVMGRDGDDVITGSSGDDWIDGGDGNDTINLGTGDDTLVVSTLGSDTVNDFDAGDTIDITTYGVVTDYDSQLYLEATDNTTNINTKQVIWYHNDSVTTGLAAINEILTTDGLIDETLADTGLLLVSQSSHTEGYYWEGSANEGHSFSGSVTQVFSLMGVNDATSHDASTFV